MTPWYSFYFCTFCIVHFFQIIIVFLFLARHDQYFKMFKDSNVFEFIHFPFKTKHTNTMVYPVNSNYLFARGKQEKNCRNNSLIESTVYLLIFRNGVMVRIKFREVRKKFIKLPFTGDYLCL